MTKGTYLSSEFLVLCKGNPSDRSGFPVQRASNRDIAFISWSHQLMFYSRSRRDVCTILTFSEVFLIWWYATSLRTSKQPCLVTHGRIPRVVPLLPIPIITAWAMSKCNDSVCRYRDSHCKGKRAEWEFLILERSLFLLRRLPGLHVLMVII